MNYCLNSELNLSPEVMLKLVGLHANSQLVLQEQFSHECHILGFPCHYLLGGRRPSKSLEVIAVLYSRA